LSKCASGLPSFENTGNSVQLTDLFSFVNSTADFDKFLHLIEYLLYGCTLVLAFARSKSEKIAANSTMLSIITGILYAISDEVHQIWVPGRDCNLFDFIADATGLLIGIFLFQKLLHYRLEKEDLIYQKTSHK
jgi:VanZ family protein